MPKKIPIGHGRGGRVMTPLPVLIRGGRSPVGALARDLRGKKPGRGAYLCPDPACLARAKKSRAIERALSAQVSPQVWEGLEAQMKAGEVGD